MKFTIDEEYLIILLKEYELISYIKVIMLIWWIGTQHSDNFSRIN